MGIRHERHHLAEDIRRPRCVSRGGRRCLRGPGAAEADGQLVAVGRLTLPVVKGAAAVGLLSVTWFPRLARLTTAMLTLYFALAVGAHLRVRDKVVNALPAAVLLTLFAVMTARGPERAADTP